MAIASDGNTIFPIGGHIYSPLQDLIKYDLNTSTFTYHDTFFPKQLYGWGQYWAKISNKVYITDDQATLNIFDLSTNQFISNWNDISIPISGLSSYYAYVHNNPHNRP